MKSLQSFYSVMGNESLLYHYTSFETVAAYILPSRNLQLSPLSKSRDAIESINYFSSLPRRRPPLNDFSNQINDEIRNHIKILCFSKDMENGEKERLGMMLARMWSQYGENHGGVCLVFSKDKLLHCFEQSFQDENCRLVQDVSYNQNPFAPDGSRTSATISLNNQKPSFAQSW